MFAQDSRSSPSTKLEESASAQLAEASARASPVEALTWIFIRAPSKKKMKSCLASDDRPVVPQFRQLHTRDAIVTEVQDLFLPEETERLRAIAETHYGMNASTVVGKDGSRQRDARRTSRSAFIDKGHDEFIQCIETRISTVAGLPTTHLEPLQVTDYTHKQEYKAHYDYFGVKGEPERTTTLFAYLEDKKCDAGACGGATAFYNLTQSDGQPLRYYPKKGNAIMWSNRRPDGSLNESTLHSGEAVTCQHAHKVGLNAWFRDAPW